MAAALATYGRPGDVVAYCPDQLGPSVFHLLPADRYRQITFPRETGPQYVNWVELRPGHGGREPGQVRGQAGEPGRPHPHPLVRLGPGLRDLRPQVRGDRAGPPDRPLLRPQDPLPGQDPPELDDRLREHGPGPVRPRPGRLTPPALTACPDAPPGAGRRSAATPRDLGRCPRQGNGKATGEGQSAARAQVAGPECRS